MYKSFFVLKTKIGPVAFAAVPKCGQHTFMGLGATELPFDRIDEFPIRMVFIREPFDRLASCYFFFQGSDYSIEDEHLQNYETFIDWALDSDDEHVMPQSELFSRYHFKRRFLVSDMCRVLSILTGEKIPKLNASLREDLDQGYKASEIQDRYRDDFLMVEEVIDGVC